MVGLGLGRGERERARVRSAQQNLLRTMRDPRRMFVLPNERVLGETAHARRR